MSKYDIVILSGGFDPPHVGHVRMAIDSARFGEKVIIGVNSDEWLMRKKGYVFMPWSERAEIMSSIKGVDQAVEFSDSDNTAVDLIKKIKNQNPDLSIAFANGGDRAIGNTPEKIFCESVGIDMLWSVGGEKIQSSSDLVSAANDASSDRV